MKKAAIVAAIVLVLGGLSALGGYLWWEHSIDVYAQQPFGPAQAKSVEIAGGARMKEVAAALFREGVISDESRFYWLARKLKKDRQIKAGEYEFEGPQLPEKILETIAQGKVKLYHCTLAEGLRLDEIAPLLEKCGFGKADELLKLARDSAFAKKAGVPADSLEGFLFPDTYSFPKNPKPEAVLHKMVGRFMEEFKKAEAQRKPGISLNALETATLASIIEKETAVPEERRRVSCLFHNRLKKHMRLETDPTVIYAKILRYGSFDGNITHDDLRFQHPYNTYKNKGLPPGPIACPGKSALEAALNPIECDDLFFVACGGGTHKFCPDFKCHDHFVDICQRHKQP